MQKVKKNLLTAEQGIRVHLHFSYLLKIPQHFLKAEIQGQPIYLNWIQNFANYNDSNVSCSSVLLMEADPPC